MKVICITGKAESGKDTAAQFMKEELESRGYSVLVAHFATDVKHICKDYFDWDGKKDEPGRSLLQYVGTNKIRSFFPNYWVDRVAEILTIFDGEWDYVLIPDCRFPNECDVLKGLRFDVSCIRVERPNHQSSLTPEQQQHPSETAMDGYRYDIQLNNIGTMDDFRQGVLSMLDHCYLRFAE